MYGSTPLVREAEIVTWASPLPRIRTGTGAYVQLLSLSDLGFLRNPVTAAVYMTIWLGSIGRGHTGTAGAYACWSVQEKHEPYTIVDCDLPVPEDLVLAAASSNAYRATY
jgi:hypothetical protein